MAYIESTTPEMEELTEMMDELTITEYPNYLPRRRGRPKQYFTEEEKINRQREDSKRYYYKNQDAVLNRIRAYKDANQDMIKEKAKEYYQRKRQIN